MSTPKPKPTADEQTTLIRLTENLRTLNADSLVHGASLELTEAHAKLTLNWSNYELYTHRAGIADRLNLAWQSTAAQLALSVEGRTRPTQDAQESPTTVKEPASPPAERTSDATPTHIAFIGLPHAATRIAFTILEMAAGETEIDINLSQLSIITSTSYRWTKKSLRLLTVAGVIRPVKTVSKYPVVVKLAILERPWKIELVGIPKYRK